MNTFFQIIWMIFKMSLFGLALLLTFGGGLCGLALTFTGGFGSSEGVVWGIALIVVAIVSGFVSSAIAKSFKKNKPPKADDGSGWGNP